MVSISTTVPCRKVGLEPISLMSVAWVFLRRVAPTYFFANNESLFCYRSLMQETMAATSFYILSSFVETNVGSCHACLWETADWSMVCYCTALQPQSLSLTLSLSLFLFLCFLTEEPNEKKMSGKLNSRGHTAFGVRYFFPALSFPKLPRCKETCQMRHDIMKESFQFELSASHAHSSKNAPRYLVCKNAPE